MAGECGLVTWQKYYSTRICLLPSLWSNGYKIHKYFSETYIMKLSFIHNTSLDKSMLLPNSWYHLILKVLTCFPEQNPGRRFPSPLHLHFNIRTVTWALVTSLKAAAPCSSASLWLDPKLTFSLLTNIWHLYISESLLNHQFLIQRIISMQKTPNPQISKMKAFSVESV